MGAKGPTPKRAWVPMQPGVNKPPTPDVQAMYDRLIDEGTITAEGLADLLHVDEVWVSDRYRCGVRYLEDDRTGAMHLSIHDHKRSHHRDWRHYQRIKNEVAGAEREAVEIYPAESRLVDSANEFHLWVMPEGEAVPFGFTERFVKYGEVAGNGNQRPETV